MEQLTEKDFKCAACKFQTNSLEILAWHQSECPNRPSIRLNFMQRWFGKYYLGIPLLIALAYLIYKALN